MKTKKTEESKFNRPRADRPAAPDNAAPSEHARRMRFKIVGNQPIPVADGTDGAVSIDDAVELTGNPYDRIAAVWDLWFVTGGGIRQLWREAIDDGDVQQLLGRLELGDVRPRHVLLAALAGFGRLAGPDRAALLIAAMGFKLDAGPDAAAA